MTDLLMLQRIDELEQKVTTLRDLVQQKMEEDFPKEEDDETKTTTSTNKINTKRPEF